MSYKLAPAHLVGAFSFLLVVTFVPGISGAATTPRWALLSLLVPWLAAQIEEARITAGHVMLVLFLSWAAVTLTWSFSPWDGLDLLWKLLLFVALFWIGAELPTLRPVAIGLGLGFAVNSAVVLAQLASFDLIEHIPGPTGTGAGLFLNKNFAAESAALALILAVGYRLWWLVPGILPSVIVPGALGTSMALATVTAAWVWGRSRIAGAVLLLAMICAAAGIVHSRVSHQMSAAERTAIWIDTAAGLTPLGSGLGSFYTLFPGHAPDLDTLVSRPSHAHNDLLELAYETGLGALLFAAFLLFCLVKGPPVERAALLAFTVEGLFAFPLSFPIPVFVAGLACGRICRDRVALRNDLALWRISLRHGLESFRQPRRGARTSGDGGAGIPARAPI